MIFQAFYMKNLDEIDTLKLPSAEIQVRSIARNISLISTFIVYAIFLPLLMIFYDCCELSKENV
jgi:hypothetical protein